MIKKIWQFLVDFLKNYFVVIALILIFLLSNYSFFHPSFFHVHDFTHAARIAEMARALDEGQLPVRWSANFGYGFGMPLFNFYAPLPYFIGALFFKMGFDLVTSIKLLCIFINLVTIFGSYLLGKKMLGRFGGLLLVSAYALAPYRAVNLFVRGAFSEVFAMAFLPLVLFAIVAFAKEEKKKYLLLLLISILAIILSHNLTAMIFLPLAALFTFVFLFYQKKLKLIYLIAMQFLLALGLSAFYMLPAFMEKDLTIINKIFSGYFHYSHHFLYIRQFFQDNWQYGGSAWGPNDDVSFFLGKGQLFALATVFLLGFYRFIRKPKQFFKSSLFFYILIFTFFVFSGLFMSILKSKFIWDQVALLQYIQFPWRFLSLVSLFLAILAALSVYLFKNSKIKYFYALVLFFILLSNFRYFKPKEYLDDASALYYGDSLKIQNQMSETLPDYIPIQMAEEKILLEKNQSLPTSWLENIQANTEISFLVDRGFEKLVAVNLQNPEVLNFKVANFIGWQAELDGQNWPIQTNRELGNIQIEVPAGQHKVGIRFTENTIARLIGDLVSLLALLISLIYFYPFAKDKIQEKKS